MASTAGLKLSETTRTHCHGCSDKLRPGVYPRDSANLNSSLSCANPTFLLTDVCLVYFIWSQFLVFVMLMQTTDAGHEIGLPEDE